MFVRKTTCCMAHSLHYIALIHRPICKTFIASSITFYSIGVLIAGAFCIFASQTFDLWIAKWFLNNLCKLVLQKKRIIPGSTNTILQHFHNWQNVNRTYSRDKQVAVTSSSCISFNQTLFSLKGWNVWFKKTSSYNTPWRDIQHNAVTW